MKDVIIPVDNLNGELPVNKIIHGDVLDALRKLPSESIDCIITSPPYWGLRDYGVNGQIGLEPSLEEYLEKMLEVTDELKRVLKKTGVMFWNHGDCYGGSGGAGGDYNNAKCMALQNYRLIIRMVDEEGWTLRNTIIWHKPTHIPSGVRDRFTNAYEPVFMLTKDKKYWFDLDSVRIPQKVAWKRAKYNVYSTNVKSESSDFRKTSASSRKGNINEYLVERGLHPDPRGKNPGDVWAIPVQPFPEAHFATFPMKLIEPMIKAGCPEWICKKCGKPRERITKRTDLPVNRDFSKGQADGWTDCGCNAGWKPGIVLDPFLGSGTTALVALKSGRNFIGIELNRDYCEMALKRIKPYTSQRRLFEVSMEDDNLG